MSGSIVRHKCVSGFSLALFLGMGTMLPGGVLAASSPTPAVSESALRDAVRAADAGGLMNEFEHPTSEVSRALAAMAMDRVTWHLDHSTATAQTCAMALRESQPVTAFFCAKFAAGNLRLKGDYAGAARADVAAALTFKPVADADPSFQGFQRDAALYLAMPAITVERSGDGLVPLHFDEQHAYTMDVSVNGQPLRVGLDTGAATTLSLSTARRVGVRIVVRDHGTAVGFLGKTSPQALGIIDTLELGGVTVRHVPVEVVDEGRDVIGNDVLMQMGRFKIIHDALELPLDAKALMSCQEPMLVSTAAFGGATLLVKDIAINGTPRRTLLDTGDSFVVTGSAGAVGDVKGGARRKFHIRDLTRADRDVEAIQSHMSVTLAGTNRTVDVVVYPGAHLPYDYILGGGALKDVSLEVDFDRAHLCVTAK